MKITFKNQIVTLFFSYLLVFSYSSSAIDWFGDDDNVIWKIGLNQYIKYASQDSSKFGKNEHPVILDEKEVAYALKALEYEEKSLLSFTEQSRTVFTSLQLKVLSQSLSKGLKHAKPEQDIIFVLEKSKNKLLGLKDKTFNAGRVFYKDGKLNIIMGDYEYFRSEAFEKTYDPGGQGAVPYTFNFGKRTRQSKAFENIHFNATGIEIKQLNGEPRHDWLIIDIKKASAAYLTGLDERKNPATKVDKQLEIEAAKLAKQRREMRAEMARMRKEVQAVSKGSSSTKSIEERMATLDQLLDKKLITQEEYDSKRQEILNDI
jgi:putative oligomerization/nucleic acid binding protein